MSSPTLTNEQYENLLKSTKWVGRCLIWTGFVDTRGYGRYLHKRVHRLYYEYHYGVIPEGTELAHSCNVKLCLVHVRPKTHKENMTEYSGKTPMQYCSAGHALTEDNVYVQPRRPANRKCIICRNAKQRDRYWRSKRT